MEKKILFPKVGKLIHGGDYNPEQWLDRPDILEEDIRLMKEAGMNSATLGMFSWSVYEPEEGVFHFEWLEKIIDGLYENGIYTVLGTPSGARPAWLDEKYPEAMRVSGSGVRNHHGLRHNHCMSSPKYREKTAILNEKLAEKFGKHPGLMMWHISNELGGECYCDLCKARFQEFLRIKFHGDIEALNREYWTTFWSHRYNCFEQIEPPYSNGEKSIQGLNLDWKRFTTWNMTDFMKSEIAVLRKYNPEIPITTNFMRLYNGLDYYEMAKELDVISWDGYPDWNNDYEPLHRTAASMAFDHSVMRSLKPDMPFMLMESVPSLVNWHPCNKLKRPGVHKLSCLQAIACGSDTVQYFQWRKGRGSFEQYHGAVVDHLGRSDTRVFKEVAEVGNLLDKLEKIAGTVTKAEAAMLFDWDNRWAIADMAGLSRDKKYEETCRKQYMLFLKNGMSMDVISPEADFSNYKVLVAPMLYLLKPGAAGKLKAYVRQGGMLIATYLTGYVNENTLCFLGGFPGDGLTELFGLYTEEIDTLYPSDKNSVHFDGAFLKGTFEAKDFCEIIKPLTAQTLAVYTDDFYQETAAVTVNSYGEGKAFYVGARLHDDGMESLYDAVCTMAGLDRNAPPQGVEYHVRVGERATYEFYLNFTAERREIRCKNGDVDLVTGDRVEGRFELEPFGVAVLEHQKGRD